MTTQDADSGEPSGLEDSVPGAPQAAEPELDAYGLPAQQRRPTGRAYLLGPAALICGIVSLMLAGMAGAAHGKLAGYQVALGILSSCLAMLLALVIIFKEAKDERIKIKGASLGVAGSVLGFMGFILLTSANWSGGGT